MRNKNKEMTEEKMKEVYIFLRSAYKDMNTSELEFLRNVINDELNSRREEQRKMFYDISPPVEARLCNYCGKLRLCWRDTTNYTWICTECRQQRVHDMLDKLLREE